MIRCRPAALLLATTALAAGLCACKPDRSSAPPPVASATPPLGPLDPGEAYAPSAPGPAPAVAAYAYPQRAYRMSRVVHQRPPSYAFDYGGERPWAWDDGGNGTMFAEPIADGYRYYYYEPGEDRPYFVQDPDYGYAYGPNGALIALFAATGALIAADHWDDYGPRAEGYWTRGYDLDRAYRHGGRFPVQPSIWRERAPAFYSGHDRWFRDAQAQPGWGAAAAWTQARGHDNGLHLGWFKDHGGRGRDPAFTGPPHGGQGWRQARQEPPAPQPHGPGEHRTHGPESWRDAHAGRGPQRQSQPAPQPTPAPHGASSAGDDHGGWKHGGGHEGGHPGGGQAFSRAQETHGGNAAWRGGGAPGGGGGHSGGGDHGRGEPHGGGNHGGDGGGKGGGGNHGGGGKGGGHGHDR